ncbi:FAD-binding protein, partial [Chloroflexota bacterium]
LRGPKSFFKPIATPPYYAIKVWPLITNTQGGPVHNAKQQVLDSFGKSIPRLYAIGELGSMFGHVYGGGGNNIGECFTSGRIAASNATVEKIWD